MKYKHVLIIGLDGGTLDLIRPWAEQGHLPNLKRLMDQGVTGNLMSTFPPVTSPAWPTFMTGMNPGKHGVFDFIRPKGISYEMVNYTSIQAPTIWDRLDKAGVRVGVINVPVTYPIRPLKNGWMISGLLSPRQGKISFPDDLIKKYEPELGPYRITPDVQYAFGEEEIFIKDVLDIEETRGKYTAALLKNEPWDVAMVVFGCTDIAAHALWRYMDPAHPLHAPGTSEYLKNSLRSVYAKVDEQVGKILEVIPEDTAVLVMSDHGFGPLHWTVNLNMLLLDAGLMHLKKSPMTQIKSWLFRRGITPKSVYKVLERVGLHHLTARVSRQSRNAVVSKFLSYDDVDWERTIAFSMGHVGQIYINVKDRHPQGWIEQGNDEWEARQKVMDALEAMRHPVTGKKVVDRIIAREQEFRGPFADQAPDLQVILDGYNAISFPLFATNGELFTEQIRGDSGCHRSEGTFVASGPGIQQYIERDPAHITDIAPTVMYLLGLPVPAEMDGKPLTDILIEPHPVRIAEEGEAISIDEETGLSPEETAEIKERLSALGYLE
jgi:predicted AlkP superfamily phosphohydrolase/phosphomutase